MEGVRLEFIERSVTGDNDARTTTSAPRFIRSHAQRRRKRLHLATAQAIEGIYLTELDRVADAISAHYGTAENPERAFEWGIRAWQAASSRLSWDEAMTCIERAGRATEAMAQNGKNLAPVEQLKLLFALGETNFAVGNLKKSDQFYGEAIKLARGVGDRTNYGHGLAATGSDQNEYGPLQRSNCRHQKSAGSLSPDGRSRRSGAGDPSTRRR